MFPLIEMAVTEIRSRLPAAFELVFQFVAEHLLVVMAVIDIRLAGEEATGDLATERAVDDRALVRQEAVAGMTLVETCSIGKDGQLGSVVR
ncbi:hypothetical protein D3C80_1983150 [compost metagenome]